MLKFVVSVLCVVLLCVSSVLAQTTPPPGRSIAVLKVGTGTGTVTTSVGNVNCGIAPAPVVCLSTFRLKVGTPVSMTAVAATGSVFAGYVGLPVACPTASCSFVMPHQHVQVRATFKLTLPLTPDTTPPGTPILRGYTHSPTLLQLEWPQVTDNEGVHSFDLQRCLGVSSTCTSWAVVAEGITALTSVQSGLVANTHYVYRLQARDWAGNRSLWSDILTLTTPTTGTVAWTLTPTSFNVSRQATEDPNAPNPRFVVNIVNTGTVGITLHWSSSTAWIVDVVPENGVLTIAPGATGLYSFTVTKTPWGCVGGCILPPQVYTGSVSIAGGATTKEFSVTMNLQAPAAPGKVRLTWDGLLAPMLNPDGALRLNPDGTPVTATGYHIWRSLVPGGYSISPQNFAPIWSLGPPIGEVPYGTNTFTDITVMIGTIYYYVVTSYNEAGDSPPSNEVNILVSPTTGQP